jgi:hypothetical protein
MKSADLKLMGYIMTNKDCCIEYSLLGISPAELSVGSIFLGG